MEGDLLSEAEEVSEGVLPWSSGRADILKGERYLEGGSERWW